jgi:hypothetical protein
MRLRGELREELRAEGFGASDNEDEYMHLDDDDLDIDDLAYLELPTDAEAAESADEQRALMASFEMHQRDELGRRLMAAGRRAGAADLAASQQRAHHLAHRRNMAAAREARVAAEQRQEEEERARAAVLARARENQYPLPSYYADAGILEDAQRRRQQWREERNRHRL